MIVARFPRWVWAGAWGLAFVGGWINVIGLLGFEHQAVTHLTGTTSMVAAALGRAELGAAWHYTTIIAAFMAGTVVSGVIIQDSTLRLGRRYGVGLLLESFLLAAAVPLLAAKSPWGIYAATCACGLQNAMVSTYSGTVVRTTHLSGMFTDLGIFLGHALRGLPVDRLRLRLCGLVISGFMVGGVLGTLAYGRMGYRALLVPSSLTASAAAAYGTLRILRRRTRAQGEDTFQAAPGGDGL